jgi:hypothetical protein
MGLLPLIEARKLFGCKYLGQAGVQLLVKSIVFGTYAFVQRHHRCMVLFQQRLDGAALGIFQSDRSCDFVHWRPLRRRHSILRVGVKGQQQQGAAGEATQHGGSPRSLGKDGR